MKKLTFPTLWQIIVLSWVLFFTLGWQLSPRYFTEVSITSWFDAASCEMLVGSYKDGLEPMWVVKDIPNKMELAGVGDCTNFHHLASVPLFKNRMTHD